jgi:lipoprotein NlpI
VEVGKLFWLAGRRRIAVESFDAALDQAPELASTYVEVISFLGMRGYFDEALDAYHRALARDPVSEYLKAYATFWILDLGRRLRVDPEKLRLAEVYLKHLRGKRWYHQLARYYRGALSYAALRRRARTTGQRVEADFYHAMHLLRTGKTVAAERLLRGVAASNMMAFFEYKMARYYLEHGAPTRVQKVRTSQ